MNTPIKTQCPHCYNYSQVQQSQLDAKAIVSCPHCKKKFLANRPLTADHGAKTTDKQTITSKKIDKPDTPITKSTNQLSSTVKNTSTVTATGKKASSTLAASESVTDANNLQSEPRSKPLNVKNNQVKAAHSNTKELIHDDLIYDDMDIDESEDTDSDYGFLDDIDVWLDDPKTVSTSETNIDLDKTPTNSPSLSSQHKNSPINQTSVSSVAANSINANVNGSSENAWLEQLLQEQKDKEKETDALPDTDLEQLLINMGAPRTSEAPIATRSNNQTLRPSNTSPARISVATVLWTAGCMVLVLLLLAQYVIFNLNTLIKNPAYAERLQTVCSIAVCRLPSADLAALSITDLSYNKSQIKTSGDFSDIQLILNNQSMQAQLLPSVKVRIFGSNALIGEFIADPNDYLLTTQNQLAAKGLKPMMFTVPIASDEISRVIAEPIY